jgi:hypothetical protein
MAKSMKVVPSGEDMTKTDMKPDSITVPSDKLEVSKQGDKSTHDGKSTDSKPVKDNSVSATTQMITAEEKIEGGITYQDFKNMFSFSIGSSAIWIYVLLSCLVSFVQLIPSFIIAKWTALPLQE